ncbi:Acetyltransferase (GNAT) domain-containing protein [Arthrobacter sp. ov407]|uniref:GNAT family N-acetyltransferase n=1 Tax=Arthrobacter sp. ov407 TaxID=1761748 RepID=UPI0008882409|nr:GNAT family N-acetyltransferase [Arthrobacter sp. ov407]SDK82946.1 Acetyltransferase (GNAT) domain-containing protein [Arthrobacter sp. ov407]
MSPSAEPVPAVTLLDVSEGVLEELLELALGDADADEVTPPLGSTPGWNTDRISWFREFHRASAAGLDGPAGQKSWAISCDGQLAGSVRLRRTGPEAVEAVDGGAGVGAGAVARGGGGADADAGVGGGALETGIWLARSFRGRGVGREALRLVKALAASAGATVLVAETTAGNVGALALLKSAGAELETGAASETETVPVKGEIPLA